jgi:hypothetical protein
VLQAATFSWARRSLSKKVFEQNELQQNIINREKK